MNSTDQDNVGVHSEGRGGYFNTVKRMLESGFCKVFKRSLGHGKLKLQTALERSRRAREARRKNNTHKLEVRAKRAEK